MRQALTPAELRLWLVLRNQKLEGLRFRRQAPLGAYIVDFFCPRQKLIVEIDGGGHGRFNALKADAERDSWLRSQGHRVLRFSNQQVLTDLEGVCSAILAATLAPG